MSWGLKPCFSAFESGCMTPFFIPYLSVRIRTLGRLNIRIVCPKVGPELLASRDSAIFGMMCSLILVPMTFYVMPIYIGVFFQYQFSTKEQVGLYSSPRGNH
jgi:hypothetical protein